MRLLLCVLAFAAELDSAPHNYELKGRIVPGSPAAVSLFGATTPFHADTVSDSHGYFRFRELVAGDYTVAAFIPGRGEARQTVEIGPGTADSRRRVDVVIRCEDSAASSEELHQRATVSTRELSIRPSARREYAEAQKKLSRRDIPAAVAHLEKAVELAPHFSAAWNNLGTIAYQTREYAAAESHFRRALEQDPGSFEPLVNLGGVLLTEGKLDEALKYNLYAVLSRPHDALANSQLGMTYFAVGNLDLAEKYLAIAIRSDPAHFSYPQLTLAQLYLRRRQPADAAKEFRDFLERHPDAPQAARVRDLLANLSHD